MTNSNKYRIVEHSHKDCETQNIRTRFYIEVFQDKFWHKGWNPIMNYYGTEATNPKAFISKDEAIKYVKNLKAPLPKDVYHYM